MVEDPWRYAGYLAVLVWLIPEQGLRAEFDQWVNTFLTSGIIGLNIVLVSAGAAHFCRRFFTDPAEARRQAQANRGNTVPLFFRFIRTLKSCFLAGVDLVSWILDRKRPERAFEEDNNQYDNMHATKGGLFSKRRADGKSKMKRARRNPLVSGVSMHGLHKYLWHRELIGGGCRIQIGSKGFEVRADAAGVGAHAAGEAQVEVLGPAALRRLDRFENKIPSLIVRLREQSRKLAAHYCGVGVSCCAEHGGDPWTGDLGLDWTTLQVRPVGWQEERIAATHELVIVLDELRRVVCEVPEDMAAEKKSTSAQPVAFAVYGGARAVTEFLLCTLPKSLGGRGNWEPKTKPRVGDQGTSHFFTVEQEHLLRCWVTGIDLLREACLCVPSLPVELLQDSVMLQALFGMMGARPLFDYVLLLLEDIIAGAGPSSMQSLRLEEVPGIGAVLGELSSRELARFCRVLALLLSEPEDALEPGRLTSIDLLRSRARVLRPTSTVLANVIALENKPEIIRKLVHVLRVKPPGPGPRSLSQTPSDQGASGSAASQGTYRPVGLFEFATQISTQLGGGDPPNMADQADLVRTFGAAHPPNPLDPASWLPSQGDADFDEFDEHDPTPVFREMLESMVRALSQRAHVHRSLVSDECRLIEAIRFLLGNRTEMQLAANPQYALQIIETFSRSVRPQQRRLTARLLLTLFDHPEDWMGIPASRAVTDLKQGLLDMNEYWAAEERARVSGTEATDTLELDDVEVAEAFYDALQSAEDAAESAQNEARVEGNNVRLFAHHGMLDSSTLGQVDQEMATYVQRTQLGYMTQQVEVLFVITVLSSGKRKDSVNQMLAGHGIVKVLNDLFHEIDWANDDDNPSHRGMHGENCECNPSSSLKVQFLRLAHNFCDREGLRRGLKRLVLSDADIFACRLLTVRLGAGQTRGQVQRDTEAVLANVAGRFRRVCSKARGLLHNLVLLLKTHKSDSPHVFWIASTIESFLRGATEPEQLLLSSYGLMEILIDQLLQKGPKSTGQLQTNFDLLAALVNFSPAQFRLLESALGVEQIEYLIQLAMTNLVDSNVFLRVVLASMENFLETDPELAETSILNGLLTKHRIVILRSLMTTVQLPSICADNICVLNTALLILLFAHRRGQLSDHLAAVEELDVDKVEKMLDNWKANTTATSETASQKTSDKFEESNLEKDSSGDSKPARVEKDSVLDCHDDNIIAEEEEKVCAFSGQGSPTMVNYRKLLWFWRQYYLQSNDPDRDSLAASSRIPFSDWMAICDILCADDGKPTSLLKLGQQIKTPTLLDILISNK